MRTETIAQLQDQLAVTRFYRLSLQARALVHHSRRDVDMAHMLAAASEVAGECADELRRLFRGCAQ
jgi:hypothetical protein